MVPCPAAFTKKQNDQTATTGIAATIATEGTTADAVEAEVMAVTTGVTTVTAATVAVTTGVTTVATATIATDGTTVIAILAVTTGVTTVDEGEVDAVAAAAKAAAEVGADVTMVAAVTTIAAEMIVEAAGTETAVDRSQSPLRARLTIGRKGQAPPRMQAVGRRLAVFQQRVAMSLGGLLWVARPLAHLRLHLPICLGLHRRWVCHR